MDIVSKDAWASRDDYLVGESWNYWNLVLETRSEATQRLYLKHMVGLLESLQWTTDDLYQKYADAKGRDKLKIPALVMRRVNEIENSGYSSGTAHHTIKAARSFFKANGENLTFNGSRHKVRSRGQRIIEKHEIKRLIDLTGSLQNKAIIITLKDTGLRVSDIVKLNYGHVKNALSSGRQYCILSITTKKTGTEAKPILGSEALELISQWVNTRDESLFEDTPLFIKTQGEEKGTRLPSGSIVAMVLKLCKKANLQRVSAHSLRKYHTTMLQAGGVTPEWIAIIQGRIISDSRSAYTKPQESQLIEAYERAYDKLRVFVQTPNEVVEDIQKQNQEMRERQVELENTNYELQNMLGILEERFDFLEDFNKRYGKLMADLLAEEGENELSDKLTERISEELLTDVRKQPKRRRSVQRGKGYRK